MRRLFALLLVLVLLPAAALAADYCECPDAQTHAERQEALERILRDYDTMGASIALIRDGRIIDTFQYGRANRADSIPVDSETYFRLASISKMITAVGVLQLVEQGVLSLDADLGDYYPFPIRNPYFPDTPITLRHLMSHTSSLSDGYHYDMAIKGEITRLEFVFDGNYTDMNYQRWEPGTRVSYSNFGGGMLGALIEQTTGYLIDEYMTFSVFAPLGVAGGYHTPCLPPGAKLARLYNVESTGMTLDPATLTDCDMDADGQTSYTHSAGGLTMTAEGVAKVLIAIAGDGSSYGVQLLQPQTVAQMRTVQNNIGSVHCNAERGLNLNIITDALVEGRTLYGHQGKAYGTISAAYCDPTDQTGVVMLTNGCDDSTFNSVARIARALITQAYEYLE